MLEYLYLGSKPPKEEYMHNFSKEEKAAFRLHIQKEQEFSARMKQKLGQLIADGCPAEFMERHEPRPSTALDIKYAMNRIAANDPHALDFHLSKVDADAIGNPDRLALDIAKALRHNTNCKYVTLNGIGLTDNGMVPILRSLPSELTRLDIAGNNITDKSLEVLETIMASLKNKWAEVNLGEVSLTSEQEKALEKHPNLYFESAKSSKAQIQTPTNSDTKGTIVCAIRNWFQKPRD